MKKECYRLTAVKKLHDKGAYLFIFIKQFFTETFILKCFKL